MGTVYSALDVELDRRLAVKVMRTDLGQSPQETAESRRRFLQEARAAAALAHPGITTIYRIGEAAGQPYLAMEWLDGESLEAILNARAPLGVPEAASLGVQLAEALDAAHAAGVVHRDVKPANLMVLRDGRLKVMDFGIARLDGSDLVKTRAGEVFATPLYASPEQLTGQLVDGRSDIFSAGVILYLALTGRLAFAGANLIELSSAVLHKDPIAPHELNPLVPTELSAVVLRALRKDRGHRFARARDLAAALRPFALERPPGGSPLPEALAAGRDPVPAAGASTVQTRVATLTGLPASPASMVGRVVSRWREKRLGKGSVSELISRLLEVPLHAEPFCGAVRIGDSVLLVHDGWILAALDLSSPRRADEVMQALPEEAEAVLYTLPSDLPSGVLPLLATLLAPATARRLRHADLDSRFVNLPALARTLQEEGFSGVLTLRRNADCGSVLFVGGQPCLTLFSDGWSPAPVDEPWESWVSDLVLKATVEETAFHPVFDSYRRVLRNHEITVNDVGQKPATGVIKRLSTTLLGGSKKLGLATSASTHQLASREGATRTSAQTRLQAEAFEHDGSRRLLSYLLDELPGELEKRGRSAGFKYIVDWVPLVTKAFLHHDLPRPSSRSTDFFDLVTTDDDGKALHVAHRAARGTPAELRAFIEKVTAAKTARTKTGDIGGAILVAPSFDEEVAEVYRGATAHEGEASRFLFGTIEAATHYEGFVRIGARRGFHLLLVAETATGFDLIV